MVVCTWNPMSKYNTKHVVSAARLLKNLNFRVFSDPFLFPLFVRAVGLDTKYIYRLEVAI
jgi:hypothetical protein